jgi:hypothetical protein
MTHLKFYYRTYGNMALEMVDLNALDFNPGAPSQSLLMGGPARPINVTGLLLP